LLDFDALIEGHAFRSPSEDRRRAGSHGKMGRFFQVLDLNQIQSSLPGLIVAPFGREGLRGHST
jgi:hypothetical protein